jgi:hypothetical protein
MNRCIVLFLSTISVPSLAAAQDITMSGGLTLGFGTHDVSEIDQGLQTTSLDGRIDVDFGNGFSMGVDVGYLDLAIDEVPIDLSAQFIGLEGGYALANGLSFGAYFEDLTASADILPIDLSLESYGLTAGYRMEGFEFGAFFGQSSTSPDLGLLAGIEIDSFGLTARYTGVERLTLGGAFLRDTLQSGGDSADIDFLGVAADYAINEQFSVFGGLSKTSVDLLDVDVSTVGLGVGYNLPELSGVNSTLSLELARSSLSAGGSDVGDLDTIRLGLTIPLGGKGNAVPLNSVADSILNPRHGALNTALTGAF